MPAQAPHARLEACLFVVYRDDHVQHYSRRGDLLCVRAARGLHGGEVALQVGHLGVEGGFALLQRAEWAGLLPAGLGQAAADAYRQMRHLQHRARLNEDPTALPLQQLQAQRDAVLALWRHVMG